MDHFLINLDFVVAIQERDIRFHSGTLETCPVGYGESQSVSTTYTVLNRQWSQDEIETRESSAVTQDVSPAFRSPEYDCYMIITRNQIGGTGQDQNTPAITKSPDIPQTDHDQHTGL